LANVVKYQRETEPWTRLDGETTEAFRAFTFYRDLPSHERTYLKAWKALRGLPPGQKCEVPGHFNRWSQQHQWMARAIAWDDEQDRLKRVARQDEIEAMTRRHAQQLSLTMQGLTLPMIELAKRIRDDPANNNLSDLGFLTILDMVKSRAPILPALVQAERLARGMSTENVEQHTTVTDMKAASQLEVLAQELLSDPDTADLASELFTRIASRRSGNVGEVDADGVRLLSEPESMGSSETS